MSFDRIQRQTIENTAMANSVRIPKHLRNLKAAMAQIEQERLNAFKLQLPPWYVYDYQDRTMRRWRKIWAAVLPLLMVATGALEWWAGASGKLGDNPAFVMIAAFLVLLGVLEKIVLPLAARRWVHTHPRQPFTCHEAHQLSDHAVKHFDKVIDHHLQPSVLEAEARRRLADFADEHRAQTAEQGGAYREGRTYLRFAIEEKPRESEAPHAWQTPYDELVATTETTLRAKA